MQFKVPLVVCPEDGQAETMRESAIREKEWQQVEQIGPSLVEAKALLPAIQRRVVERQTAAFLAMLVHC
jgi:hypothetical protein